MTRLARSVVDFTQINEMSSKFPAEETSQLISSLAKTLTKKEQRWWTHCLSGILHRGMPWGWGGGGGSPRYDVIIATRRCLTVSSVYLQCSSLLNVVLHYSPEALWPVNLSAPSRDERPGNEVSPKVGAKGGNFTSQSDPLVENSR